MLKTHRAAATALADRLGDDLGAFRRDLNAVLTRGVWKLFRIARDEYREVLDEHAVVDFPEALERALALLAQRGEFTRSRYLLESRYHHLLVDEFQDTSDAQWQLVWHLVQAWREGVGMAQDQPLPPTIFVVGDRKQSIYGFRDADARVLARAAVQIRELRGDADVSRAIRQSFRAVPPLLSFTNDLCAALDKRLDRDDAFTYDARDEFPVPRAEGGCRRVEGHGTRPDRGGRSRVASRRRGRRDRACDSQRRRARSPDRRRPAGGCRRRRDPVSHARRTSGLPARPRAAWHPQLRVQGPRLLRRRRGQGRLRVAAVSGQPRLRAARGGLSAIAVRAAVRCRARAPGPGAGRRHGSPDRIRRRSRRRRPRGPDGRAPGRAGLAGPGRSRFGPPSCSTTSWTRPPTPIELGSLDEGPARRQARENLKKVRGLVRRIENRGYATLARVADYLDRLSAGDESAAAVDAVDSVNLMTVHAAKGLEFPVVFLVNLGRGGGGGRDPIRVAPIDARRGDCGLGRDVPLGGRRRRGRSGPGRAQAPAVCRRDPRARSPVPGHDARRPRAVRRRQGRPGRRAAGRASRGLRAGRIGDVPDAVGGDSSGRARRAFTASRTSCADRTPPAPPRVGPVASRDRPAISARLAAAPSTGARADQQGRPRTGGRSASRCPSRPAMRQIPAGWARSCTGFSSTTRWRASTQPALEATGRSACSAASDRRAAADRDRTGRRRRGMLIGQMAQNEALAARLSGPRWHEVPLAFNDGRRLWRGALDALVAVGPGLQEVLRVQDRPPAARPRGAIGPLCGGGRRSGSRARGDRPGRLSARCRAGDHAAARGTFLVYGGLGYLLQSGCYSCLRLIQERGAPQWP